SKAVLSKLITVKVATIALVATTAGGVALAAGTGEIPGPFAGGRGHGTGHGAKHPGTPGLVRLCHIYLAEKNHSPLPERSGRPRPRPTGSRTAPSRRAPQDHTPPPRRSAPPRHTAPQAHGVPLPAG